MRLTITITIIIMAIMILSAISSVTQHEIIHQEIFKLQGIKSETNISLEAAYTKATEEPKKDITNAELAHEINESITYNTQNYFIAIIAITGIIAIIQTKKLETKEKK